MKVHPFLLILLVASLFLIGCDKKTGGGGPVIDEGISTDSPDDPPGNDMVPSDPPSDPDSPDGWDDDDPNGGQNQGTENGNGTGLGGDEQPVPEPSTLALVGSGLAIISLCRRKKKNPENE
jgi:hypothetical protein